MIAWALLVAAAFTAPCASAAAAAANTSIPLRIMPVGASVTFGVGSTTGDSYRKDLRDTLVAAGFEVNMVGSKRNGNDFTDNDVEATSGFVISQIAASVKTATPKFLPNLVLVDAGTNNCNNGGTVPDAGKNVTAMLDEIYALSPGATVVLTTVLANKVAAQDACRVDVNKQYESLATNFTAAGKKFVLVDMRSADGPTTADLNDTRHPNDRGYQKMAVVWNKGIQEALGKGFITKAADNGIPANGDTTGTASTNKTAQFQSSANSTNSSTSTSNSSTSGGAMGVASGADHAGMSSVPSVVAACFLGLLVAML